MDFKSFIRDAKTGQGALKGGQGVLQPVLAKEQPLGLVRQNVRLLGQAGRLAQGEQLLFLAGARIHLADLGQLKFQKFAPVLQSGHASLHLGLARQNGLQSLAGFALDDQDPRVRQKGVQNFDVVLRREQALLSVLAGVHQKTGPQFGQALLGAHVVVDEKAAAACFGGQLATQEQFFPVQAEHGLDQRLFTPRADQIGGNAFAEDEIQGAQDEGVLYVPRAGEILFRSK